MSRTVTAFPERVITAKILLVDDDRKVTSMVATFFRRIGRYELREENDSSSAAVFAREFRPDLAILDVDMPGKDGGEVATEFKNDPVLQDVTLIFMSGLISEKDKGVRNGAVYLPKPFPLLALHQVVEIVLAGRLSRAQASKPRRRTRKTSVAHSSSEESVSAEAK
jgi:DNA-binding response OmpR family regulator